MKTEILIFDDDVTVAKVLSDFLSLSGFETYSANSADEAEEILKRKEIKTVLTDIKMPGTNGIDFTKNIKKKYDLDVIVMTSYRAEYLYEDAINSGASDLLFKPIKFNELILRINRVLKERSLLDERNSTIKKLERLTIEDQLTELFNSRHFFDQLDNEIRRSERYLHPISLIFIDVDNFKSINDTHGHMIGDKILSSIAKRIKTCLRANDTAFRYAGDEFTIILPETASDDAKIVADRILSSFASKPFLIDEKEVSGITLSIGITEYHKNEGGDRFVHRADVTMYQAKQNEGNSIMMSPDVRAARFTVVQ